MKDTENVETHTKNVNLMVTQIKQNTKGSKILLERNNPRQRKQAVKKKTKRLKSELKQLLSKNIKHPYSDLVGEKAEIMWQFYGQKST